MRYLIIACLMGSIFTGAALADIIATYKYQSGETMTFATRDKDHVRMESSPDSYMLIQEGKAYAVNKDENGQWMVMDMEQMKAMASVGLTGLIKSGPSQTNYTATYEKTGKTEKIAGYTGAVYTVNLMENDRLTGQEQVVLSTHPDIEKLNQAWAAIGSKMGQIMDNEMSQGMEEMIQSGYGGILRYGNEMCLDSLKKNTLDLSYYQLPKGAQVLTPGQMTDVQEDPEEVEETRMPVSQDPEPRGLDQDVQDVTQAAKDEAKDATIEETKKQVRSLFNSLLKN